MEQIHIVIRPPSDHEGRLRVDDAMQQVLDTIRLLDEARKAMGNTKAFEWRLERASTNSPLTVVAVAEPLDQADNIEEDARRVTRDFVTGIRRLVEGRELAPWMTFPPALEAVRHLLDRSQKGVASTEISIAANEPVAISPVQARTGLNVIAKAAPLLSEIDLPEMIAEGEIDAVIVSVGSYNRRPALRLYSDLYEYFWCLLSPELTEQLGDTYKLGDIWEKKTLLIEGTLMYGKGGKLSRIDARSIHPLQSAERIDLDDLVDPDFTAGLDPVEYLRRLHDGRLN